jgi:hypothetical protein
MGDYGIKSIIKSATRITLASLAMGGVMYLMVRFWFPLYKDEVGFLQLAPDFMLISVVGLTVYLVTAKVLRVHEVSTVSRIVRRNLRKIFRRG